MRESKPYKILPTRVKRFTDRPWISDELIRRQEGIMRLEERRGCPYEDFMRHNTDIAKYIHRLNDVYNKNGVRETLHKYSIIKMKIMYLFSADPENGLYLQCEYCDSKIFIRGCHMSSWMKTWVNNWEAVYYRAFHEKRTCQCGTTVFEDEIVRCTSMTDGSVRYWAEKRTFDHFFYARNKNGWDEHESCKSGSCPANYVDNKKCVNCGIRMDLVRCVFCKNYLCNTKNTGSWRNGKSCHMLHILNTDCLKKQVEFFNTRNREEIELVPINGIEGRDQS